MTATTPAARQGATGHIQRSATPDDQPSASLDRPQSIAAPLMEIRDLVVSIGEHQVVAIRELDIPAGRRVALIGESGAGKTVAALSLLDLQPRVARVTGSVRLEGLELIGMPDRQLNRIRGSEVGVVLQDPASALNPVMKVGRQIDEALRMHHRTSRRERRERVLELMEQVQLPDPERLRRRFPHQLSGGQRQRVMIAIAIACRPRLLIADEPSSALDVNVQAEILDLLVRLSDEQGMSLLLISHNLGVVRSMCDDVAVLYGGQLMERGPSRVVVDQPRHRYTQALIKANPDQLADSPVERTLTHPLWPIPGETPSVGQFPSGCHFRDRCTHALDPCADELPITRTVETRTFSCWNPAPAAEPEANVEETAG
ncbi:ABC transporter ATP-binding protein [Phytoactinopolyspora alkaliphila]|uniref:ABC transporter ATP-binding protein n=1 Tax=Phytoactinopolyspora alkaliphila TaxID=1783498 RepID=A0A6N9YNQ1_9ACTN|nr:ABC transporter ATP-binding protein [Phytoactinopolyspora alkaliphila]NED96577.1 ABC transporter ATP-binding protein [Phytoactinopolyspora alkaliphila]